MSNVKAGDMARYVGLYPELHKRVVVVLRQAVGPLVAELAWVVTPPMPWPDKELNPNWVADRVLRKIEPPAQDAVDEVLREVGHPLSASHRMKEKAT